jgi:hypothetical protein
MTRSAHKFNAVRTEVDGISFSSKAEAKRYCELKMLEKAGKIECLELQPRYPLVVVGGFVKDIHHQIGTYVADFRYYDMQTTGAPLVVEDVKGFKTELYRWKKKHVEAQYGIKVTEITR